ncbi:MAG: signal peptide peptidase SppA [Candidatus Zixiibacteriota bacterium]|nr:MAG: signal peptide peptidase SppA [candidate division Zixibacteria bacterium]
MAKTRDIVVGLVIVTAVLMFFMIVIISILGISRQGGFSITSLGDKIAVVEVNGVIERSEDIVRQLKKYGNDNSVRAIVLRINSPGGVVAPTQEIYNQILKVREDGKYVVVSMSSVTASGGYYIACAGDSILANPGTLTGSIGVMLSFLNFEGLMDKVGVEMEVVKSNEMKDVGNYSREMTQKEREMLQAAIDDTYDQFVITVSEARNMDIDQVEEIADGSIYTGSQALDLGLIDKLGGLEDAITMAGQMAGLGDNPRIIREYPRRRRLFDYLVEKVAEMLGLGMVKQAWPRLEYIYK